MRNQLRNSLFAKVLAIVVVSLLPPSGRTFSSLDTAHAHGGHVRLRNDLTKGAYTQYDILVRGKRHTPQRRHDEEVVFEQAGRLRLLVLPTSEARPKEASRVWMMQLDDPVITSFTRGGQPVADVPHPKMVGLPPRSVQLHVAEINAENADAVAVGGSRVQRAAMLLALDFAHWPDDIVEPNAEWKTPSIRPELEGGWTHRYSEAIGTRAERLAVGTFAFEGKLAGPFDGVANITSARGEWRWRVSKRSLESVDSRVVLEYGPPGERRELEFEVNLKVAERRRLRGDDLSESVGQIQPLSDMARDALQFGSDDSKDKLKTFINEHPDSLWLPVAKDILDRAELEDRTINELSEGQLVEMLVALVRRWQGVAHRNEVEKLEPIRSTYREIAESNGDALLKLTRSEESNIRAISGFAIAFGKQPKFGDRVIELARDPDATVRAWAVYGLAERREPKADAALLMTLLDDDERNVRIRACMAAEVCTNPDDPKHTALLRKLLKLIDHDDHEQVQVRAASAVSKIAIESDLPTLIDAEFNCDMPPARRILEATIRTLGGEPRSRLDD